MAATSADASMHAGSSHAERISKPQPPVTPSVSARVVSPRLVGRELELELLAETLAVPPAVAVIEGEAGIGKTRLIAELAARPEVSGRRWLIGACRKIREPFPLGPVIEAVRGLGRDDRLRSARLSPVVGALRALLPELANVLPLMPEPLDDRAAERHRVFRALAELLGALGPAVLVLEDLHWADEHTAEFLSYLAAEPPELLSVVVTYRGEEVDPGVRAVTAKLPATVGQARVALAPLGPDQTGILAASILGTERVSSDFAEHLHMRASGVPFAVEELLALLRARGTLIRDHGRWARKAIDDLDVPTGIRDPVLERVSRMSAPGRQVVEAAAVLQEPMPVSVLLDACAAPADDAPGGVAAALASGLLVERNGAIAFRHVLAAQAVHEAMPGLARSDLHDRAAAVLEKLEPTPLGQLAHHLRHAGRLTEWADAAERAADQAIELGHDAEAVRLLDDVLCHACLDPEQRGRLAVKLGRAAHETLRSSPELIDLLTGVLEQDLPPGARGELAFWLSAAVQDAGGDAAFKRRLLLEAVDHLDDRPELQAWAMVGLGMPTHPGVPLPEHKGWLGRVLEILPKIDDRVFVVFLLGKIAMVQLMLGDLGWSDVVQRIDAQTGGTPRRRREVNAYLSVGMAACYTARYSTAERLLVRALDGAVACESVPQEVMIRSTRALLDCCRGRWDGLGNRVETLLDELADVPLARVDVEVAAGILALAQGDLDDARRRLTEVVQQLEAMGEFDLLALAFAALARLAVARSEAEDTEDTVARLERLLAALATKALWAPVARVLPAATQLLIAVGRQPDARALIDCCERQWVDLDAPLTPAALWQAQGFLAADRRDGAAAGEDLLAAAEQYEQLECPYEAAQAREQAAVAMFEANDVHAEETLLAALAGYQGLGATWDAGRCTRLARSHGVRLPVPHRGGRKGYGEMLSPREEEVARLAAAGMSNKKIGEKLFLSPATVEKHLGRAMRKLGVHSRAAVAGRLLAGEGTGAGRA